MGNKLSDLKKKSEALRLFEKLPLSIIHDKFDPERGWVTCSDSWYLRIDSSEHKTMHENNSGKLRIAYVLEGWEGEAQAIPFTKEEQDEMLGFGAWIYTGGIYGDSLEVLIKRMYDWIISQ